MAACVLKNKSYPKVPSFQLFAMARPVWKVARGLESIYVGDGRSFFIRLSDRFSELHNVIMPTQISRKGWFRVFKVSQNFKNKLLNYTAFQKKKCEVPYLIRRVLVQSRISRLSGHFPFLFINY